MDGVAGLAGTKFGIFIVASGRRCPGGLLFLFLRPEAAGVQRGPVKRKNRLELLRMLVACSTGCCVLISDRTSSGRTDILPAACFPSAVAADIHRVLIKCALLRPVLSLISPPPDSRRSSLPKTNTRFARELQLFSHGPFESLRWRDLATLSTLASQPRGFCRFFGCLALFLNKRSKQTPLGHCTALCYFNALILVT